VVEESSSHRHYMDVLDSDYTSYLDCIDYDPKVNVNFVLIDAWYS